jgi:hypothetical protein
MHTQIFWPSLARVKRAFSFSGHRKSARGASHSTLLTLAALLLAWALPDAAFAQNMIAAPGDAGVWTVYAFGNAAAISETFQSLYNFTASALFQSVVSAIAVLGVLAVGMTGGFNQAVAKRFVGYSVAVFLVCYILFGVGNGGPLIVQVEVDDVVDGTWEAPVTVPAVIGIPASMISTAGYDLTQQLEASFQLPSGMLISNGAPFDMAAAMLSDASQADITDPNLASSLSYYVQDCVIPAIEMGYLTSDVLINSTNFIQDMQVNLQSIYVNSLLVTGQVGVPDVTTCAQDWTYISQDLSSTDAGDYFKSASAWAQTPALSVMDAAFDTVAQWSSNGVLTSGGSTVQQAAVLNAFTGAFKQSATATGNSDFLTSIAVTQAEQTQTTSWVVGAEVFNHMMGYVFAILQVFIYSLTPLILMVVLVPGLGLALLKNFMQILLWLALWQPLLAVVNFIVLSMQQTDITGIMSNGAGTYGFTLTSIGVISQKTANLRAAAMFVGTMTPVLAWAMVKGSIDFSRIVGTAVGEHFAQSAASTMVSGNYSLNTGSADNYSANKTSVAANMAEGHGWNFNGTSMDHANMMGGEGMPSAHGQTAQVTPTSSNSTTTNTNTARGVTQTAQGGTQYSAGNASGVATTGAHAQSGGSGESTGTGDSLNANASANWRLGGPGGKGGPSAGSTPGTGEGAAQLGTGFAGLFPTVGGGVGINKGSQFNKADNSNTQDLLQTAGTRSANGSVTDSGSQAWTSTYSAQQTTQSQVSQGVTATGLPSDNMTMAALQMARGEAPTAAGVGIQSVIAGTSPDAALARTAAVQKDGAAQVAKGEATAQAKLAHAEHKAHQYMGAGNQVIAAEPGKLFDDKKAADRGAVGAAEDGAKAATKGAIQAGEHEVQKAREALNHPGHVNDAMRSTVQAMAATSPGQAQTPDNLMTPPEKLPVQPDTIPGSPLPAAPAKADSGNSGAAPSGGAAAEVQGKVREHEGTLREVREHLSGAENLDHSAMKERVIQLQDLTKKD